MWKPIGLAPLVDRRRYVTPFSQPLTGRASALAQAGDIVRLGAAGGGVWWDDQILQGHEAQWNPTTERCASPIKFC